MLIENLRDRVRARIRRADLTFPDVDVDYAIQQTLELLDLDAYWALVYTDTAEMTSPNPETDISAVLPDISGSAITGIRPERVQRVELAFTDRGTWSAAAVSYAVDDLITNTGTPNNYFYVCVEANTSTALNQPGLEGGSSLWEQRLWKHGDVISLINRDEIGHALGDRPIFNGAYPQWWPFPFTGPVTPGKPRIGAFLTENLFLVWPPPDRDYLFKFLVQRPITEWEPGTSGVDLIIPNNVIIPCIDGICAHLDADNPYAEAWMRRFEALKRNIDGRLIVDLGPPVRDQSAYRDHTDGLLNPNSAYGRFGYPWS